MTRNRIVLCVFTLFARGGAGLAQAATGPARARLDAFATGLHSLTGHFSQTLTNVNGQTSKPSNGTLALEAPREFRWDTTTPYQQPIIAARGRVGMSERTYAGRGGEECVMTWRSRESP